MQMDTAQPFGKYLLLDCVAVGGMAEIFRAKTVGADGYEKEVAVKRILPSYSEDDGFVTMFKDEAKIAAQLDHPNIVKVYDFDEVGGDYYIAMELIRGTDLKRLIESADKHGKRFTPTQIAYIASETAKALDYAHKRTARDGSALNIVHRDVTPHNVMISHTGEVKLMDFGIAKAASRATKTRAGTVKGKCAYMSPEQARGKPLDGRSDMFSLGIIMWEMLTGRRLFSGGSDFDVLSKVLKSEIVSPRDIDANVPQGLADITMRILDRDRDQRFRDCGHLLQELEGFLLTCPDAADSQLGWYVRCLSEIDGASPAQLPDYVAAGGEDDFDISGEATQMLDLSEMQARLDAEEAGGVDPNASTQAMDPASAAAYEQQLAQQQQHPGMMPHQQQPGMMQPGMMQPGMMQPGMMQPGMMQPGAYGQHPTGMMPGYAPHPSYAQMPGMMPPGMMPPQQKSRAGLIIGIVVVVLLLGGAGVLAVVLMGRGETSETAEATEAKGDKAGEGAGASAAAATEATAESMLTLTTIPPGATVTINGQQLEQTTNIYGHKVPRGQPLSITFELEGYEPLTVERRPLQQAITLEETLVSLTPPEPEPTEVTVASLAIASEPEGSTITIEGRDETVVAPGTIEDLPLGEELTLVATPSSSKYEKATQTVTLVADAENKVSFKHDEKKRTARSDGGSSRRRDRDKDDDAGGTTKLTVTAIPWGQVYLDGENLGTTPVKKDVPSGKHKLEISFPAKKQRASKTVKLKKGGSASYSYDFNNEDWR